MKNAGYLDKNKSKIPKFAKELSLCHKLWFSNHYVFGTKCHRPMIFQTMNSVRSNNLSLKYQRFTTRYWDLNIWFCSITQLKLKYLSFKLDLIYPGWCVPSLSDSSGEWYSRIQHNHIYVRWYRIQQGILFNIYFKTFIYKCILLTLFLSFERGAVHIGFTSVLIFVGVKISDWKSIIFNRFFSVILTCGFLRQKE